MSTIVIFGGTGYAGGNIAREAVSRGHQVISYSRTAPAEQAAPAAEAPAETEQKDAPAAE